MSAMYRALNRNTSSSKRKALYITSGIILAAVIVTVVALALSNGSALEGSDEINVTRITASSHSSKFPPELARDSKENTGWSPSRKESKTGEYTWIKLHLAGKTRISGVKIINGLIDEDKDLYDKYNRVRSVRIMLSDYASYYWVLKNDYQDMQILEFPEARVTTSVKIFIHTVYRGTHWNRLCLGEVELF